MAKGQTSKPAKASAASKKLAASKAISKTSTVKKETTSAVSSSDVKAQIIANLNKLMGIYQNAGEKGKVMGYRRAISGIKSYDKPIKDVSQMDGIPGVGDGIKKKVAEFLAQGNMTKLDELKGDKKIMVLDHLGKIWGVGPVAAQRLYAKGIRDIKDLKKKQDLLTNFQKIGLKYFDDFQLRMSRDTATNISKIVKKAFVELYGKLVKVETCGSYRRGKPTCGDVDILVTRTDNKPVHDMLEPILIRLEEQGFLKERLGNTRVSDKGSEMYMGVCKAPGDKHHRRIDIKVYPKGQYGFALLYFTGSDFFNRQMREHALTKGFTLSDHGLVKIGSKSKGIECESEQDVFKALQMAYKAPHQRDL